MPQTIVGPSSYYADGQSPDKVRIDRGGAAAVTAAMPPYYELSNRGQIFTAHAIVTAPVIYTTAAGTGGPLLWNGSSTHKCVLLAVGFGTSVVTTVAATLGLTGGSGQAAAPATTTAIDSVKNTYMGGPLPAATAYRIGTVSTAGSFFHPIAQCHTGALTVDTTGMQWVDMGGLFVLPQFGWISWAASATASTLVGNFGMIWAEVPNAG